MTIRSQSTTLRRVGVAVIAATLGIAAIGLVAVDSAAAATSSLEARLAALKAKTDAAAPKNASVVKPNAAHAVARKPGGAVLSKLGNKHIDLTSSDCRVLGGTVVTPGDDRCGKIGASYCRFPDTNAMCIEDTK